MPGYLAASPSEALQVLEDCAKAHAHGKSVHGLEQLRPSCPGLEQALDELQLAEHLGPDWRQAINGAAIADVARLARRYQGQAPGIAPATADLPAILQAVRTPPVPLTWWQRFKQWLQALLQQGPDKGQSWLARWRLPWQPSQWLLRMLGYSSIAAVLLLAFWIVWREMRAARAPASPARRRRQQAGSVPQLDEPGAGLPDLQALPPAQRAGALLAALVGALRRSGRLELERALTHRQLGVRASFDDEAQRARFVRIALLAERCLYGTPEPIGEPLVADAVTLYTQLSAPKGRPA